MESLSMTTLVTFCFALLFLAAAYYWYVDRIKRSAPKPSLLGAGCPQCGRHHALHEKCPLTPRGRM